MVFQHNSGKGAASFARRPLEGAKAFQKKPHDGFRKRASESKTHFLYIYLSVYFFISVFDHFIKESSTHAAPIPTPLASEDSL